MPNNRNWKVAVLLLTASAPFLKAQYGRPTITKGIQFEQKLNSPVPLDLVFKDETGQTVPLRTYFGEKPVVLSMVYFTCPSLCPMSLHETVTSLHRVPLKAGQDYNVVVVSFDPADTPVQAAAKKAYYAREFGGGSNYETGFHFLTGTKENATKLGQAIGFGYRYDPGTKQFIHAGGIMIATPDGRMARYFYGIDYAPADLRMGLVEASAHRISSPVDYVLLFCFHYDAAQGKYTLAIFNVLKLAALITLLGLGGLIYLLMRKDKRAKTPTRWRGVQHVR